MNRAFTIVECLIAIAILMLAIAGPLYSASRSLSAANQATQRLTASYLAQEGIEYVRYMRDTSFIAENINGQQNPNWWGAYFTTYDAVNAPQYSIANCIGTAGTPVYCTYDPQFPDQSQAIAVCPTATDRTTCTPLYLQSSNGSYLYTQTSSGNTKTIYTRSISAQIVTPEQTDGSSPPPGNELLVMVDVSWVSYGSKHDVIVTDHLTPWQ